MRDVLLDFFVVSTRFFLHSSARVNNDDADKLLLRRRHVKRGICARKQFSFDGIVSRSFAWLCVAEFQLKKKKICIVDPWCGRFDSEPKDEKSARREFCIAETVYAKITSAILGREHSFQTGRKCSNMFLVNRKVIGAEFLKFVLSLSIQF